MQLIIVTGLSGAGKSTALRAFEDFGFYCVDNLPPTLIPAMARLCIDRQGVQRVALGVDIRGGIFFEDVDGALKTLENEHIPYEVLFMDASNEELIRRYKETRRSHPMGGDVMLVQSIVKERSILSAMKERATRVVNTTTMLTRQVREMLLRLYGEESFERSIQVNIVSFGFKRGLPQEADMVFDVRFLPNPYYDPAMRPLTGRDDSVRDYVLAFEESSQFLEKLADLIDFLIPNYIQEGKPRLVIGIGCTGGQHRSVALAEALGEALREQDYHVFVSHRDIPS